MSTPESPASQQPTNAEIFYGGLVGKLLSSVAVYRDAHYLEGTTPAGDDVPPFEYRVSDYSSLYVANATSNPKGELSRQDRVGLLDSGRACLDIALRHADRANYIMFRPNCLPTDNFLLRFVHEEHISPESEAPFVYSFAHRLHWQNPFADPYLSALYRHLTGNESPVAP